MLKSRLKRLESLAHPSAPREQVVVYMTDFQGNPIEPSPDVTSDPNVDFIRIRFVKDWRSVK